MQGWRLFLVDILFLHSPESLLVLFEELSLLHTAYYKQRSLFCSVSAVRNLLREAVSQSIFVV